MQRGLWISTLLLILFGCNQPLQSKTTQNSNIKTVVSPLSNMTEYERYRSGVVQLNGATEVIEEIKQEISKLYKATSPSNKNFFIQVSEQLDEARACVADYCEDPLPIEQYKQQKNLVQQVVDAANDAIHELNDLYEIFDEAPKDIKLKQIEKLIDESIKNLEESITTLGGKIEE